MEHVTEGCQCEGKVCTKCELLLCIGKFTKRSKSKDKLELRCRGCRKAYYSANAEHMKAYSKRYRRVHREQVVDYNKQYYFSHPEQFQLYRQLYYEQSGKVRREKLPPEIKRQKRSEQYQNWYQKNRRYHLQWRRSHPEKAAQYNRISYERGNGKELSKEYRRRNPDKYRERGRISGAKRRAYKMQCDGAYTLQEWRDLKERYNYTCLCCRIREPETKLTADHIVPLSKGGHNTIDNIQPLCFSCNSRKKDKTIDFRPQNP